MKNQPTSAVPTWRLIFIREITDLWVGGKALILAFIYTVFLSVITYVIASNSELSLIPPKEMVYETIKNVMAVSLFIGWIIGADALSGERDRGTLEPLLLTPTSRRQIMVGKFLAAMTFWQRNLVAVVRPELGAHVQQMILSFVALVLDPVILPGVEGGTPMPVAAGA